MPTEIERKFLIVGSDWRTEAPTYCVQGYLNRDKERTVRVRIMDLQGFLTVKGLTVGATRPEFEYEIPLDEAHDLLPLCHGSLIQKMRHVQEYGGLTWEVDEFLGDNSGLIVGEVELEHEHQAIIIPPWAGKEVTDEPRYYNSNLSLSPYCEWNHE